MPDQKGLIPCHCQFSITLKLLEKCMIFYFILFFKICSIPPMLMPPGWKCGQITCLSWPGAENSINCENGHDNNEILITWANGSKDKNCAKDGRTNYPKIYKLQIETVFNYWQELHWCNKPLLEFKSFPLIQYTFAKLFRYLKSC